MNDKVKDFITLLEKQINGDKPALGNMYALGITVDDGYCLYNLYEEWTKAFAFYPGCIEALPQILSLAQKMLKYDSDDTLRLFNESEWGRLVALRGPIENVLIEKCSNCSKEYPVMATSGFYDANGLVCPKCGDVYFKSLYENDNSPCHSCGEPLPTADHYGCPYCNSKESVGLNEMSPYEYFSKHKFKRGPGA